VSLAPWQWFPVTGLVSPVTGAGLLFTGPFSGLRVASHVVKIKPIRNRKLLSSVFCPLISETFFIEGT
jgi:hypothetical protein